MYNVPVTLIVHFALGSCIIVHIHVLYVYTMYALKKLWYLMVFCSNRGNDVMYMYIHVCLLNMKYLRYMYVHVAALKIYRTTAGQMLTLRKL